MSLKTGRSLKVKADKDSDTELPLSQEQLLPSVLQKLEKGIAETNLSDEEKDHLIVVVHDKLDTMLKMYDDSAEKEQALRKMSGFPSDMLFTIFKDNTAEFLYKQAKKYFPKETV